MANYLRVIEEYYEGVVEVNCAGNPTDYNCLQAVSGSMPSQTELDAGWLMLYKTEKIVAFSETVRAELLGGFETDVLVSGTDRYYDSQEVDQLNLIGLVAAGEDALYASRESASSPTKEYAIHTIAQLQLLLQRGRDWKTEKLQKFNDKKNAILACSGIAGVDAITWED